ncbi:DUF4245 domain-containing protein [Actinomadura flavalba]|uniref:DUF4245 domain-containing protein n=1 Tax=Actinomadura flavalba TaxID=1120938 RepID=UPI00036E02EF|nr:DUF4245 domain-containing protein [Actinomadura flavalba]
MSETTPASATRSADQAPPSADAPQPASGGRPTVQVAPGVYKRLTGGPFGFAMAMLACLLIVGVIYLITPRSDNDVLPTVDYSDQLFTMRAAAPFPVHAPEGLAPGWRPTSSRVTGLAADGGDKVAWHLGFLTPSGRYAALEQSNEKPGDYIPRMTNSRAPTGAEEVAGATWQKYHRKDKGANSYARTLPNGVSLVVTGNTGYEELAVLVKSLREQPKQPTANTGS